MKKSTHLKELHEDMPEEVLCKLYARLDTDSLRGCLRKFKACSSPDDYMMVCIRVVEKELASRGEGLNRAMSFIPGE